VRWRVGLIDSGADLAAVAAAARFAADGTQGPAGPDPTGHGTRIARLLTRDRPQVELVLAQVFASARPTSAAAVAAAVDWCLAERANLLHLSLGLAADRAALAAAIARAAAAGCLVVAATPARGAPVYPAAYAGVIRATGDARCGPDEVSRLAAATFGGCVRPRPDVAPGGRGASVGAAAVSRALLAWVAPGSSYAVAVRALAARARYDGPERRGSAVPDERGQA
jgi:hypothetical protein